MISVGNSFIGQGVHSESSAHARNAKADPNSESNHTERFTWLLFFCLIDCLRDFSPCSIALEFHLDWS